MLPLSRHCDVPVAHEVAAVWQGFMDVHVPTTQAMQTPLPLQTFPPDVVHTVPPALLVPATHTGAPVAHENVPFLQSLPVGMQGSPSGHDTHEPVALQTLPPAVLHAVPAVLLVVSVHT